MEKITRQFQQNPLKTVEGVAETRYGRTDGLTDEPITIVPFDKPRGKITTGLVAFKLLGIVMQ